MEAPTATSPRKRRNLQEKEASIIAELQRVREQQAKAAKDALQKLATGAQTLATRFSGQPHAKLIAQAAQLLTQAGNDIKPPSVS